MVPLNAQVLESRVPARFLSEPWVQGQGLLGMVTVTRSPLSPFFLGPKLPSPNKVLTANTLLTCLDDWGPPGKGWKRYGAQPGCRFRDICLSCFKQRKEMYRFTHQLQAWLDPGVLSQVFPSCAKITSGSSGSSLATLFPLAATKITRLILICLSGVRCPSLNQSLWPVDGGLPLFQGSCDLTSQEVTSGPC